MKFSWKILLCSMITMAVALGIGGYFFVNDVFEAALERETEQALDESSILQFAFETAALNIPSKYAVLQNGAIGEIGANLEKSGQGSGRLLRLSDENQEILYASEGFVEDQSILSDLTEGTRAWKILESGGRYYIQTGSVVTTLDRVLYLETMRDVTAVYEERARGFEVYRNMTFLILVFSSVLMYFLSSWLTKPIRLLTQATQKMTAGDYSFRAEQISSDEMGQLTGDFNHMASVVEETIHKLENEVRAREDFIAAFSHELKTPLTSVIGYADLLRSRKLDDEKHFLSANYIYTEGKRLEAMSLKLLDIIVARRYELEPQDTDVEELFGYLRDMYAGKEENPLVFRYEPGQIQADASLLKTVLLNLVDNACKASKPEDAIEILGVCEEQGYLFSVKDYGVGIPEEECRKITEAFYMVDKSRSRSNNGAGLGLALCAEILKQHGSMLMIESTLGEGSCFSFRIPCKGVKANGTEENEADAGALAGRGGRTDFRSDSGADRPL